MRTKSMVVSVLLCLLLLTTAQVQAGEDNAPICAFNEENAGSSTVNIYADPSSGEAPLEVFFRAYPMYSDNITQCYWIFDEGMMIEAGYHASHLYITPGIYTAKFTVVYNDETTISDSVTITVMEPINHPPIVDIYAGPLYGEVPLQVLFRAYAMDPNVNDVITCEWTFGDGTSSAELHPVHLYHASGVYTATFTATDDKGATGSDNVMITVMEPNLPPMVYVYANPIRGKAPLDVLFGSQTIDDGIIALYHWTFGDGTSSAESDPLHRYTIPGTYIATLIVTDDKGAIGSDSVEITVEEPVIWLWVSPDDAIASSSQNWKYVPENAIDGLETRWLSKRQKDNLPWIQFDLGSRESVRSVQTIINENSVPMTLDVLVSNDAENWDTVISGFTVTEGDTSVEIPFAQTDAKYIKLQEHGKYGTCTEFKAQIER